MLLKVTYIGFHLLLDFHIQQTKNKYKSLNSNNQIENKFEIGMVLLLDLLNPFI